jgi:hypothetical protein
MIEPGIMMYDYFTVSAQMDITLRPVAAEFKGELKGPEGVFYKVSCTSTVCEYSGH